MKPIEATAELDEHRRQRVIATHDFLSEVIPQLRQEVTALHSGNAEVRKALWSHLDPLTLFGAEYSGRGWDEIEPVFDKLATTFSGSVSCDYEVQGADVSGDLGYVVAIERSVAASLGGEPQRTALRVTTVLRRVDDRWKVVHRHGDPFDDSTRKIIANRKDLSMTRAPEAETGMVSDSDGSAHADLHPNFIRTQEAWDAIGRGEISDVPEILTDDVVFDNGPGAGPWRHVEGRDEYVTWLMQFIPFFEGSWKQKGRCIYASDAMSISLVQETGTAPSGDQFDNDAVYVTRFGPDGRANHIWTVDLAHEALEEFWRRNPIGDPTMTP